jgi:hypothetical protein
MASVGHWLGIGIAGLYARLYPFPLQAMLEEVARRTVGTAQGPVAIVPVSLGADSALLGQPSSPWPAPSQIRPPLRAGDSPQRPARPGGQPVMKTSQSHHGFQCGSVYKPIYLEAQAAVALATYLRAGQTAPTALVNSTTTDPTPGSTVTEPAVLLTPVWVTGTNMEATVITDKAVDPAKLCAEVGASVCTAAGIH